MNELFSALHTRVLGQQRLIEEQITQLCLQHGGSNLQALTMPYPIPKTIAELRHQIQTQCTQPMNELFAFSEKESASALFLKYSTALIKWTELELVLLKEWSRSDASGNCEENTEPSAEELSIVRHFLQKQESEI